VPTSDWAYIRFQSGRGRNGVYARSQIDEWAGRLDAFGGDVYRTSTTTGTPSRSRTPSSYGTLSESFRRELGRSGRSALCADERGGRPACDELARGRAAPYASYAAILATFGGLLAATAALERARHEQRSVTALELTLLAAASFRAARAISRERVGSVVREPFVEG
jgi:hypothetical protein